MIRQLELTVDCEVLLIAWSIHPLRRFSFSINHDTALFSSFHQLKNHSTSYVNNIRRPSVSFGPPHSHSSHRCHSNTHRMIAPQTAPLSPSHTQPSFPSHSRSSALGHSPRCPPLRWSRHSPPPRKKPSPNSKQSTSKKPSQKYLPPRDLRRRVHHLKYGMSKWTRRIHDAMSLS
jgi:hypothetical protein